MKAFRIIMRVLSITLILSTLICGLSLASGNTPVDAGSLQFHMTIGILGIVFSIVTFFLPGKKAVQ